MEAIANLIQLYEDVERYEVDEVVMARVPRIIPVDRSNPMAYLSEGDFVMRYRLSKEAVRDLLQEITPHLKKIRNNRGCSVPYHLQLLVTLRYLATGDLQITMGDCSDMSTASVTCAILHNIAIERRLINQEYELPDEHDDDHEDGEEHNAAGGPQKRQTLINSWF
ncbi:hypothetical protein Pmani_004303 [Petrolisthes manimaculis]|uniref:Nuclease HARBI1 n=1 Tax=Petrolisthes manimaculis TaxID=1843537 RepID=A0AAE1QE16_9EUCA|nr:hypothetical protein Pmani_004303 [Petrolisthes manimaculis]